ncbi:MAG TPA: carbon storage regulator CsrA [Pirellulales bacterium]|nr:carbon storage regulator CsrA [Pirellulales bacterium]
MLVLSRKVNERIQIGDDITITVVRLSTGSVRIGIEAPSHLTILRDELNSSVRIGEPDRKELVHPRSA